MSILNKRTDSIFTTTRNGQISQIRCTHKLKRLAISPCKIEIHFIETADIPFNVNCIATFRESAADVSVSENVSSDDDSIAHF